MTTKSNTLIAIIGPTAGGKTAVAVHLAYKLNGEIISADSRQVYKGMDLGTGKDIEEYHIHGTTIPYHLIDIVEPGYKYNVFEYQKDFYQVFAEIQKKNKAAILCGGTGMYIEAATMAYELIHVPVNEALRSHLENKNEAELIEILKSLKATHNKSDFDTKKRMIRAIEIAEYEKNNTSSKIEFPALDTIYFGVKYDRDSRRRRITERLKTRLKEGMIEEVEKLLQQGIKAEDLIYYGLEYKYLTLHVTGKLNYNDMFQKLNSAIHQFAKRQMTWYRRMERNGSEIHWLDGYLPMEEKLQRIESILKNKGLL